MKATKCAQSEGSGFRVRRPKLLLLGRPAPPRLRVNEKYETNPMCRNRRFQDLRSQIVRKAVTDRRYSETSRTSNREPCFEKYETNPTWKSEDRRTRNPKEVRKAETITITGVAGKLRNKAMSFARRFKVPGSSSKSFEKYETNPNSKPQSETRNRIVLPNEPIAPSPPALSGPTAKRFGASGEIHQTKPFGRDHIFQIQISDSPGGRSRTRHNGENTRLEAILKITKRTQPYGLQLSDLRFPPPISV
jgi:hypothetical protein